MAALAGMALSALPMLAPKLTSKLGNLGDSLFGLGRKRKGGSESMQHGGKRKGGRVGDYNPQKLLNTKSMMVVDSHNIGPQTKQGEGWSQNNVPDRRISHIPLKNHHIKRAAFADGLTPFPAPARGTGRIHHGGTVQDYYHYEHGKYGPRRHSRRGGGQQLIVQPEQMSQGPSP